MEPNQDDARIGIRELVASLRSELQHAVDDASEDGLRFRVDAIDLELKVTATRSAEVGGGVKFWVIDASGKGTKSTQDVQTVRLSLTPVPASGSETFVGRRRSPS